MFYLAEDKVNRNVFLCNIKSIISGPCSSFKLFYHCQALVQKASACQCITNTSFDLFSKIRYPFCSLASPAQMASARQTKQTFSFKGSCSHWSSFACFFFFLCRWWTRVVVSLKAKNSMIFKASPEIREEGGGQGFIHECRTQMRMSFKFVRTCRVVVWFTSLVSAVCSKTLKRSSLLLRCVRHHSTVTTAL